MASTVPPPPHSPGLSLAFCLTFGTWARVQLLVTLVTRIDSLFNRSEHGFLRCEEFHDVATVCSVRYRKYLLNTLRNVSDINQLLDCLVGELDGEDGKEQTSGPSISNFHISYAGVSQAYGYIRRAVPNHSSAMRTRYPRIAITVSW